MTIAGYRKVLKSAALQLGESPSFILWSLQVRMFDEQTPQIFIRAERPEYDDDGKWITMRYDQPRPDIKMFRSMKVAGITSDWVSEPNAS